jgi:hypothetical protein
MWHRCFEESSSADGIEHDDEATSTPESIAGVQSE